MNRRLVLPAGNLLGTVAWSFVSVSLPFHVRAISDVDAAATLRWTGFILGITALTTVATAPAWGWLGERADPRRLFILTQLLQGSTFLVMAAARTLLELFAVRFVLGIWAPHRRSRSSLQDVSAIRRRPAGKSRTCKAR